MTCCAYWGSTEATEDGMLTDSFDKDFPASRGNATFQVPIPEGTQPGEYTFVASVPYLVGVSARKSLKRDACVYDSMTSANNRHRAERASPSSTRALPSRDSRHVHLSSWPDALVGPTCCSISHVSLNTSSQSTNISHRRQSGLSQASVPHAAASRSVPSAGDTPNTRAMSFASVWSIEFIMRWK